MIPLLIKRVKKDKRMRKEKAKVDVIEYYCKI